VLKFNINKQRFRNRHIFGKSSVFKLFRERRFKIPYGIFGISFARSLYYNTDKQRLRKVFLNVNSQRIFFRKLCEYLYTEISDLHDENCDCGTKSRILIDNAIKYVSNILNPPPPGGTAILPEYIHYYG
jgi:hypothetical protein